MSSHSRLHHKTKRRLLTRLLVSISVILTMVGLFGVADFWNSEKTTAATGQFSVYRQATATSSITTTPVNLQWDTTIQEGTGFTKEVGNTDITLAEAGHYLVMYNVAYDTTSTANERSEMQSNLVLNGIDQEYGRASCYIRRQTGTSECWLAGAAVLEATTTDLVLQVETFRTDNVGSDVRTRGNESGLMIVRLDDDWDYARIQDATGNQAINTTAYTDIAFDTNDELDSGTFSRTGGDITLATAGHYLVTANVMFQNSTTNARRSNAMRLTLNGYELPGTRVGAYIRGSNSTQNHAASFVGVIEATTTNQILNLEAACDGATCGNITTVGGEVGITITKLPDTAEFVRLTERDTTNERTVDGTDDPITWDTQDEVDTNAFSHSTSINPSRITIEKDDDYLFFGSFYSDRPVSTSDGNRLYPHWEWGVNGTIQQYGSFGKFNRGEQGTPDAFRAGNAGGMLFNNLSAGDYIELRNTDESTVDDSNATFEGLRQGIQGIRIGSLIPKDITVASLGNQVATTTIPSNDFYVGGAFALTATNKATRTVESITITGTGTVDIQNDIDDIRLYYEYDTSSPYNCVGESFTGTTTETQYGVTDTDGFSTAGTSTFTANVDVGTSSALCLYVVVDGASEISNDETFAVSIDDPNVDVVIDSGTVGPEASAVEINGTTQFQIDLLTQTHYHWRNDDGDEGDTVTGATSATGGTEDTALVPASIGTTYRARVQISNEGSQQASTTGFRIEYAPINGTCDAATGWTDVGAGGGDWDMSDSLLLTDGNDTTNITNSARGAITDENTSFFTNNNGIKDTSSQATGALVGSTTFLELEYGVIANGSASEGTTYCFRVTDNGTPLPQYDEYPQATIAADVLVSATSTQVVGLDKDTDNVYVGGAFVIEEETLSRAVTDITITASGTLDTVNDVNDVRLYYDLDTTSPYDCTGESFGGLGEETQFGATSSSFSAAGTSTYSGSQLITTTQSMCVYVVMDIDIDAGNGQTFDVEISDPSTDITITTGSIAPDTAVPIPGFSQINGGVMNQAHYHWRLDDGSESSASSATVGTEDTPIVRLAKGSTRRLRMSVDNIGLATSTSKQFRLEYGTLSSTCSAVGSWTDVGALGGAWDMAESANITDGDDTTNIAISDGGVTDPGVNFLSSNGAVKDTSSQIAGAFIGPDEYAELEYSIAATQDANDSTTYCFRLTDAGVALENYGSYPQATTRPEQDFYIQRGTTSIPVTATTSTITAGVDYDAPTDLSRAFIRITNTGHTGAGDDNLGGTQNADDVTAYIENPQNLLNGIDFVRFGQADNTRIAWEIVEYIGPENGGNEMTVRQAGTVDFGTGDLSTSTSVSGVVDDADVVVFITGAASPSIGTGNYNTMLSTADWNGTTNEAEFLRAETDSLGLSQSYAVVEFTGDHWFVQRIEHPYGTDTDETEILPTAVSSSTTFIHAQKRVGSNDAGLEEHGQEIYLNDAGTQLTFRLQTGADNPTGHTGVAWVIENQQTGGTPMVVTRSNGTQTGGAEPATVNVNIGTTISALDNASIFMNNRVTGTGTAYPRSIISTRLISTTQYELWISDTGQTRTYRTEVVEWPTASREITQNYYRFYVDNDMLDPTDPWPAGAPSLGENFAITASDEPVTPGESLRIRMSLAVRDGELSAGKKRFKLQSGERATVCSAITDWRDLGDIGSTTADWVGTNSTVADGTNLSTDPPAIGALNLSVSDRAGTFEEENNTPLNPFRVAIGEDVEYDWSITRGVATSSSFYCFRMVEHDGTPLTDYDYYPTLLTAGFNIESDDWRWFDDETNVTPTTPLAGTNTAPTNISPSDAVKLRMVLRETDNGTAPVKFKLQYSEESDFSSGVFDVVDSDQCTSGSLWCYADGAGVEHATITERVIYSSDTCTGASGDGCGTHNEYSYVPQVIGEVGTSSTDSTGTTINLEHTYNDPVFIIEAIEGDSTGPAVNEPAAAKIIATTSSSFTVVIDEPDDEDGTHATEDFGYIVMERGSHTLPDGTRIDVGTRSTSNFFGNNVAGSDDTCSFTQSFGSAPVVVSTLQSNENTAAPDFFTVSQHSITASQFSCAIEVPDGSSSAPSSNETIGWIAIEPGTLTNNTIPLVVATTSVSVEGWTDTWYEETFSTPFSNVPGVVASKQTRNGGEGGWVRYDTLGTSSVEFAIDEADGSTSRAHVAESVGYIAFGGSGTIYDDTAATSTIQGGAAAEFEWTLTQHDALAGVTYFFRAYDVDRDMPITATSTATYPSLMTENGSITFAITGVNNDTGLESVVTDATTTATSVPFGSLTIGAEVEAAQILDVTTNASFGYQVLLAETQELISASAEIPDINASNTAPVAWNTACDLVAQTGCWGYHTGDNTLSGGSTRFLIDDTYAEIRNVPEEVAYSSGPVTNEQTNIVFKIQIDALQPAGLYESELQYIVVPVF